MCPFVSIILYYFFSSVFFFLLSYLSTRIIHLFEIEHEKNRYSIRRISETGQAVVLTLVDTAAAELQNLAEPKIELDSHSSVKNSSTKSNDRRYPEDIHDAEPSTQIPSPSTIEEESIEEDNDTNILSDEDELLGLHGTPHGRNVNEKTADIVVVVRAEQQKVAVDAVDAVQSEVRSEEEEEVELPEDLAKVEEAFGTASELNDTAARVRLISGGNRDDVAAAVIIDGLVASGPSDSHEDIPSFSEWAQKRLEEAEKKKSEYRISNDSTWIQRRLSGMCSN